ncbi:MAG: dihydrolipoyl dehydrogenase [Syntrophomonadaceae bacterium]|nr:dihydrolipoyl dehydrogenase [Syntrophomonadaceae bacterium]
MKDLIIIGGGPGGYVAAIRARQLGMTVAIVEKDAFGGTCLNRGCIPTKAYYRNALAMKDLKASQEFNIQVGSISFDMAGARQRKDQIVHNLVAGIEKLLQANGVVKIKGEATILDKNTVLVNGEKFQSRNFLLATGSVPASLTIPGIDLPGVMNSDQVLELDEVPARLAIIGGGVIGLEFAGIFSSLGSKVTVFEYLPELLNTMDHELGKRLRVFLKKQKINVHTSTRVEKIELDAGALKTLKISAEGKKGPIEAQVDLVLIATGRKPFTTGLNLEELGIATDKAGFILVDRHFSTNVEGIYAIGDVIGGPMLAHVASEEGMVAVEKMAGLETDMHYQAVPACVFTIPEIASVGISEEEAKAQGIAYRTGKFQFGANGKALTMGETDGMVKVLADPEEVIIGVHIIGPHASDLIMEGTMMVKNRLKVTDVSGTIHPHPTLSEAIMEAVLDVHGQAIHLAPPRRANL